MRGSIVLQSTQVLAPDVRQGAPETRPLPATQDDQDYLVAGRHIEASLPIRDLGCGTSRRFFSPVPSEGPREVAPRRRDIGMEDFPNQRATAGIVEISRGPQPMSGSRNDYTSANILRAALPAVLDVLQAARLLGIGRTLAYELVRTDQWPTPIIRVGRLIKIPSAPLIELMSTGYPTRATAG